MTATAPVSDRMPFGRRISRAANGHIVGSAAQLANGVILALLCSGVWPETESGSAQWAIYLTVILLSASLQIYRASVCSRGPQTRNRPSSLSLPDKVPQILVQPLRPLVAKEPEPELSPVLRSLAAKGAAAVRSGDNALVDQIAAGIVTAMQDEAIVKAARDMGVRAASVARVDKEREIL